MNNKKTDPEKSKLTLDFAPPGVAQAIYEARLWRIRKTLKKLGKISPEAAEHLAANLYFDDRRLTVTYTGEPVADLHELVCCFN